MLWISRGLREPTLSDNSEAELWSLDLHFEVMHGTGQKEEQGVQVMCSGKVIEMHLDPQCGAIKVGEHPLVV